MDIDLLEDFAELAKELNFSRAAELRNMTQPAFSRRIRALEDWVGAPLVRRTSRSVALTPAGAAFVSRAAAAVRHLAQARQEALEVAGEAAASLSLAATHALSFTFVPRWLMGVAGGAGLGALNLISDSQQQGVRAMQRGDVSFFICHSHPACPSGLPDRWFMARRIGEDLLAPLVAPDASGAPRWRVDGAEAAPLLAYGAPSGLGRILAAHWAAAPVRPNLAPRMQSVLAMTNLEMARQGQGVAWLPLSLAEGDIAAGRLARAGGAAFDVPVGIAIHRPRARLAPGAEALWRKIAEDQAGG